MTKIIQILTEHEERTKFARQLSVIGVVVGAVATALISVVALSGQL